MEVMKDPNPFPEISLELVLTYLVAPVLLVFLVLLLLTKLIRSRKKHASKAPKVVWRHLK